METIIISILVALLFFLLVDRKEYFTPNLASDKQFKQCDFNDPKLSRRCKEIRDGCRRLNNDEKKIENKINKKCNKKEGETVRQTLSRKRDCVTDVERLIRTKYAKNELCSQIKNLPKNLSPDEQLTDLSLSSGIMPYDRNGAFTDKDF